MKISENKGYNLLHSTSFGCLFTQSGDLEVTAVVSATIHVVAHFDVSLNNLHEPEYRIASRRCGSVRTGLDKFSTFKMSEWSAM